MKSFFNKSLLAGVVLVATLVSACEDSAPPPTPVASCRSSSADAKKQSMKRGFALADEKIDFQKDILPILSSNKDDEVYKCTTCHAGYTKEETFSSREKIDDMVAQVEGLKMPLNGDEMRKEQIDLIKKWAEQKFPSSVNQKPDTDTSSGPVDTIDWEDEDWEDKGSNRPSSGCAKK